MTRSMTRWVLAGFMAVAALGAAVFDVGSSTAKAEPSVSPFAGSWSGTFSVADHEDAEFNAFGTFDWTISDAGGITGTFHVTFGDGDTHVGRFAGHVRADGKLMVIMFPGGGGGFPHDGTAEIDGDGNLVASATDTFSPRAHTWSLFATLESD